MDLLDEHRQHFPVAHLDQVGSFLASGERHSRRVVLTFDDAWADNHTNALGPLSRHRLPATLYVPSRLLGEPGYMTRAQLLEMDSAGVTIGAHSRTHPDLRACTPRELEREVRGSKEDLEDLLAKPVTSFAYPTGLTDERVEAAVAAAGFTSAVTVRPGWWRPATKPLEIPRSFVQDFSDATFLAAIAGGLNVLGSLDAIKRLVPGTAASHEGRLPADPGSGRAGRPHREPGRGAGRPAERPRDNCRGACPGLPARTALEPPAHGTRAVQDGSPRPRRRSPALLERLAPDIIHAQDRRAGLVASFVAGRKTPVVMTFHGVPDNAAGRWVKAGPLQGGRPGISGGSRLVADALVARRMRCTVAPSRAIAEFLHRELWVPMGRLRVIHNGVAIPPRHQYGKGIRTFATVGSFAPGKATPVLVEAFMAVAANHPGLRLRMIGDGLDRRRCEELTRQAHREGQVEFTGYRTDVYAQLEQADVFVLPSLNENLPLALLQAMVTGLPCIATDVGGISEVLSADCGVLVAPGECQIAGRGHGAADR